jgi:tetratricopeptide (TPR) repeat protein
MTPPGRTRLKRETRDVPLLTGEIPPPPHPFLGRKDELDQLAEIARGGPSVTFVDGPQGMGKTALVSRYLRRAKRGRVPFWFTVRSSSSPRQFVSALSHAVSFLGNPQLAYYAQLPRNPVAKEVADMAARALGDQQLAAVVDDIQAAGQDLKKFLGEFISTMQGRGNHQFYVVGEEPESIELTNTLVHRITVVGLDRASAHELTDRHGGLADRFEQIYQSALGSPLLLKLAVSNPEIHADAATLPEAVVRRLPDNEIRAILPAALANEPLPSGFLTEESRLTTTRLQELERMGILHRTLQDGIEVLQVVRAAVLSRAGPGDEREAHLLLARFYGRSHRPEALRERFLHLVEGGDWRASSHILDEQQRVILRLGYSEALRNALRHLATTVPAGLQRVRVLLVEAMLLRTHSNYDEAIRTLRRSLIEAAGDSRLSCEAHLFIVELQLRLHQLDQAKLEYDLARKTGAVSRRLQAYFTLSQARILEEEGQSRSAADAYQRAFESARKAHAIDLALEGIASWSRLAELTGDPGVSLRVVEAALPDARQAGRMDIVFNLRLVRARAYADTGRIDMAEDEMNAIRSEAESLGYLTQLTYSLSGLAAVAIEHGHWAEGSALAKQASSLAERLGNDVVLGHTLALLCAGEFRQVDQGGDRKLLEEAIGHGLRSVTVLSRLPPTDSLVLAHSYLTEVYLFSKKVPEAVEHYSMALGLADKLGLAWLKERMKDELGAKLPSTTLEGAGT